MERLASSIDSRRPFPGLDQAKHITPQDAAAARAIVASTPTLNRLAGEVERGAVELHGLQIEHVNSKPGVVIIRAGASHEVTRRNPEGRSVTAEEKIPGIMEIRRDPEERIALIMRHEDGRPYVVARRSPAVFDNSVMTLGIKENDKAVAIMNGPDGMNFAVFDQPVKGSDGREPWKSDFTSPGGSSNFVGRRERIVGDFAEGSRLGSLSAEKLATLRERLQEEGLELRLAEDVAVETADMATFMQMMEILTPEQRKRALDRREARMEERDRALQRGVPQAWPQDGEIFLVYDNAAANLSTQESEAVRAAPAMRKLYALLRQQEYTGPVYVDWTFMPTGGSGKPTFLFASVRLNDGQSIFVRGDAVAGAFIRGDEIISVTQPRLPAGSHDFTEVPAGMTHPEDLLGGVKAMLARTIQETSQETGLAASIIEEAAVIRVVRGLYASAHSPEEIALAVCAGGPLSEEARTRLLTGVHGESHENEATNARLLTADQLAATSPDLKTRLLVLLAENWEEIKQ